MPKGHKTPPEKEEQAIALAQTYMTQEAIAEIVGISRRQVVRIWGNAGISRSSAKIPLKRSPRQAMSRTSEVQEKASLHHQQGLFDMAVRLRDEIIIPLPPTCSSTPRQPTGWNRGQAR